jgi:two-component system chemotaxis response regulator CheY
VTGAVLVIDDDPLIRRLISATLQDVGGLSVREAEDGETGVALAVELEPRVVLVDYEMPGITGVETCRRLRSSGLDSMIVMLTGSANARTEAEAREAGVSHFLTKPFSPLEVLRLVDGVTRRA